MALALVERLLDRGVLSSYLPSNQMTALKNQVAALEQNNSDLAGQIATAGDRLRWGRGRDAGGKARLEKRVVGESRGETG